MKQRPILFSGEMVRAILEGRKTQTRRVVKGTALEWLAPDMFTPAYVADPANALCPYGQPGDRLWVRETFCQVMHDHAHDLLEGWPDDNLFVTKTMVHSDWMEYAKEKYGYKWKPSIHMPRWASRITLEIVSVRVERLQDISEEDAYAEGYEFIRAGMTPEPDANGWFQQLWQSINGAESWGANPWVWVVEFRRVQP